MKRLKPWQQTVFLVLLALTAVGCSSQTERPQGKLSKGGSPPDATQGESASTTAGGLCSLFTKKEIEELLGAPVSAGKVAGPMGTACQWDGPEDDEIFAQIQVLKDTHFWINPKQAPGYEAISGIGKEAYVIPDQGGWNARALTDTAILSVALNGGKADRDRAVKLLRSLLERLK